MAARWKKNHCDVTESAELSSYQLSYKECPSERNEDGK